MDQSCFLCPRECGTDRQLRSGFCGAQSLPTVAKVMLHQWEEPCICYGGGSGAVFFSGCQMRCVFCQNHAISQRTCGDPMDTYALADLFLKLEEQGACNLNLVSPTPHLETLIPALEEAKKRGFSLPVVFNSGGYEKVSVLCRLEGLVDVYLPDFKFFDPVLSHTYGGAADYRERATEAIGEMLRQTGSPRLEGEKLLQGTIVRHLILPGHTDDSIHILDHLCGMLSPKDIILSLLRQYTPMHRAKEFPKLRRKLTTLEYHRVAKVADALGFSRIYTQEKESATEDYVPDFQKNN
ncbi:MAG: radical SAM protein [Clostridia bacterium]|nr:radical SAM protein [Clostridia bacterium]